MATSVCTKIPLEPTLAKRSSSLSEPSDDTLVCTEAFNCSPLDAWSGNLVAPLLALSVNATRPLLVG